MGAVFSKALSFLLSPIAMGYGKDESKQYF